ncbi:MAG: TIGR00730 family Rossman fold protein [Lachnospiraceae bacterium]|nr:TIGR00730 family Rossman fold protein [Lachnospiraceae bacterium]MBQ6196385.1 TIGR00730 family Rossman fold protein [Lachnospiraceae bacterium]
MKIAVYCGSKSGNDPAFLQAAKDLGRWIGKGGNTLVYGGATDGLMGAVADAVLEAGGEVIGVMTTMPEIFERKHPGLKNCMVVPNLGERKRTMMELADAYVALPGGPGTLDEISDVISLARLKVDDKPVILMNINGYYEPLRETLDAMVRAEFISADEISGVHFLPTVKAAGEELSAAAKMRCGK